MLHTCDPSKCKERTATEEETRNWIITQLATTFSEDRDFLRKINKLSFGLMSGN